MPELNKEANTPSAAPVLHRNFDLGEGEHIKDCSGEDAKHVNRNRLLRPARSGLRCDVVKILDSYETPVLSKSITMLGYSPPELLVGWVIYGLLKSLWLHVWDVAGCRAMHLAIHGLCCWSAFCCHVEFSKDH